MRLLVRDFSIPSRQTVFGLAAALGLAAAVVPVHAAAAQDPYPDLDDIGLVMHVHTETVAPNVAAQSEPLFVDVGVDVILLVGEIAGLAKAEDVALILRDIKEGTPSSSDLVVRVKDDRMRVDMGTSALLARLDTLDRSVLEWGVLDPGSGRVVDSDLFDVAVRERSSAPYDVMAGGGDNVTVLEDGDPIRTDELAQIAGHTARRYDFTHEILITPLGTDEFPYPVVRMERSSRAWIAESGPYVNDPDAAAVSREFTRTLPPELARLVTRGLLLGADDESTITTALAISDYSTGGGGSLEASSSFRVTHLSREVVDDALLAGFEQDEQACDCSCAAFEQLKELSESDPNAMGKAVCAQRCMSKWVPACINQTIVGGRD